jgi:hypothetical protein
MNKLRLFLGRGMLALLSSPPARPPPDGDPVGQLRLTRILAYFTAAC